MELAALMSIEVGKNRLEALGDVEETADLIRWSCDMMEQNRGFDRPMGNLGDPAVHTRSVLKPHGVWAVISPFNFPMALSGRSVGRRAGGRQHGGLQAVERGPADRRPARPRLPATRGCRRASSTWSWVRARPSARSCRRTTAWTASCSRAPSRSDSTCSATSAVAIPKPAIIEMGGKNPAIVSRNGGPRGGGGRRRSGGLRVSADRSVRRTAACTSSEPCYEPFLDLLVAEDARRSRSATRWNGENWLGPVINQRAVDRYDQAVAEARRDGRVIVGGEHVTARRPGPRVLRGADVAIGPACRSPALPGRTVPAVHGCRARRLRWMRRCGSPTTACTG